MGRFVEQRTIDAGLGARRVRMFVPLRGRSQRGAPRPLLVMFDGQNLFGKRGSFAGGWSIHHALDHFAQTQRTPAPLVAAIDHGGVARIDELAPFREAEHGGGKLAGLLDTIVTDLVPRIRGRHAITQCYAGGASLGGLAALFAHLLYPDIFQGALAMSPSLWFTRDRVADVLHKQPVPSRSRIYLDCGGREGASMRPAIDAFASRLEQRGWSATGERRLMSLFEARGRHHEAAWSRRFPRALRFLLAT
jgi:predicted alpha/beta superfamily hydrolase